MQLWKISSRGSGVKSMTVDDQDGRARHFEHIASKSSYLGSGPAQTMRLPAKDSVVMSSRERLKEPG
jgi:hypothetical protein